MNDKLFIPQGVLDKWVESGKVTFNDNILTLLKEQRAYTLTSAVRFMSMIDGVDTHQLIGKIRTLQKLEELGGEHMSDSVILGDTAYTVQEGFIGVVLADAEVASEAEAVPQEVASAPVPAAVVAPTPVVAAPIAAAIATIPDAVEAPLPPPVDIHAVELSAAAPATVAPTPTAAAPIATSLAQAAGDQPKDASSDADMLTKFLLNNLNF